ncbi:MAG: hypothetical protein LBT41_03140 [Candidatus Methanoplasma sp.]|jgi:cell division protein FtsB|nr:hypothetical protein [Candidatus Methanoplasma sp.]
MKEPADDMTSLKAELKALKTEVDTLKEFVRALYSMIDDEECDGEEYSGGFVPGRFNT